jgi:hypothetical protein
MATPDGITTDDWDRVHELAVDIVNADETEAETCRGRLLAYLETLEQKYGELPSILATRADYVDDPRRRETLLSRAYDLAKDRRDDRNTAYIAHSLAELYIGEFRDYWAGQRWLDELRQYLPQIDDAVFAEEYDRLRSLLHQLPRN